ncbi:MULTISPECIES: hypothetical protein [Xanthomonas]|uniref:hypothetical protein n=1 Tax=Xanthomonas TaxID=338 RepID=UPI000E1F6245|nr:MULTISPECIES: hypothetical protein [Xanthomonas]
MDFEVGIEFKVIGIGIIVLFFFATGAVNSLAVRMANDPPSKSRSMGVVFGCVGILLMDLVLFWPLIRFLYSLTDTLSGVANLPPSLLTCGMFCTLGSASMLIVAAFKKKQ